MDHPDPAELATVPLFEGLSDDQLAKVADQLEVEEFAAGRTPAMSGAHGYMFYILAEGSAHAERDGHVLEQLEAGSVFGEMAFFEPNSRRSATVVADTDIKVYAMFGTEFRTMEVDHPEILSRLTALYEKRRARLEAEGGA